MVVLHQLTVSVSTLIQISLILEIILLDGSRAVCWVHVVFFVAIMTHSVQPPRIGVPDLVYGAGCGSWVITLVAPLAVAM